MRLMVFILALWCFALTIVHVQQEQNQREIAYIVSHLVVRSKTTIVR